MNLDIAPTVFSQISQLLALKPKELKTEEDFPGVVFRGVPTKSIDMLMSLGGLTLGSAAAIIPVRTLTHRKAKSQPLDAHESSSALYTAWLIATAWDVFGDRAKALTWLSTPKKFLGNKAPLDVTNNIAALEVARNRLARLQHGYFA